MLYLLVTAALRDRNVMLYSLALYMIALILYLSLTAAPHDIYSITIIIMLYSLALLKAALHDDTNPPFIADSMWCV